MKLITIRYKTGRSPLTGYDYHTTWVLETGWNRIKINLTQKRQDCGGSYVTWYPFSFFWWPQRTNGSCWRDQLGPRIRLSPGKDLS